MGHVRQFVWVLCGLAVVSLPLKIGLKVVPRELITIDIKDVAHALVFATAPLRPKTPILVTQILLLIVHI